MLKIIRSFENLNDINMTAVMINQEMDKSHSSHGISANNLNPHSIGELLNLYKRFSSSTMIRQLSKSILSDDTFSEKSLRPFVESCYASVLIADISGFTRLSSRLTAEQLKFHINEYFSMLLEVVKKHGGDVVRYLGDAVLIIWPVDMYASIELQATTVYMACQCAVELVADCAHYQRGEGKEAVSLKLHCGIGAGTVHCMCVGDGGRWEHLISGDPLRQMAEVLKEAGVGEVGLSETVYNIVKSKLDCKKISGGCYLLNHRSRRGSFTEQPNAITTSKIQPNRSFEYELFKQENIYRQSSDTKVLAHNRKNKRWSISFTGGTSLTDLQTSPSSSLRDIFNPKGSQSEKCRSVSTLDFFDPNLNQKGSQSEKCRHVSIAGSGDTDRAHFPTFLYDLRLNSSRRNSINSKHNSMSVQHRMNIEFPDALLSADHQPIKDRSSMHLPMRQVTSCGSSSSRRRSWAGLGSASRSCSSFDFALDDIGELNEAHGYADTSVLTQLQSKSAVHNGQSQSTIEEEAIAHLKLDEPCKEPDLDERPVQYTLAGAFNNSLSDKYCDGPLSFLADVPPPSCSDRTVWGSGPVTLDAADIAMPPMPPTRNLATGSNLFCHRPRAGSLSEQTNISRQSSDTKVFTGGTSLTDLQTSPTSPFKVAQLPLQPQSSAPPLSLSSPPLSLLNELTQSSTDPIHLLSIDNSDVGLSFFEQSNPMSMTNSEASSSGNCSGHSSISRLSVRRGTFKNALTGILSTFSTITNEKQDSVVDLDAIKSDESSQTNLTGQPSMSTSRSSPRTSNLPFFTRERSMSAQWGFTKRDPFEFLNHHELVSEVFRYQTEYNIYQDNAPFFSKSHEKIETNLTNILRLFVHESVRTALEGAGAGARYMFELRNVTTIFIEILNLGEDFASGLVQRPQEVLRISLACLQRFGGALRQYCVDDKGCVVIAAFGLPGSSHEDNALRAIETVISIRKMLRKAQILCRAGVSEGNVYCGLVGSPSRCEYAMMGSSVNLAARLMGSCAHAGEILVDEKVYKASVSRLVFESKPKIAVKGYEDPVAVYKPLSRLANAALLEGMAIEELPFTGREAEIAALRSILSTTPKGLDNNRFHKVVIEGIASVGKTRLVLETLRDNTCGTNSPLRPLLGVGLSSQVTEEYYVLRQLLDQMMGLGIHTSLDAGIDGEDYDGDILMTTHIAETSDGQGEMPTRNVDGNEVHFADECQTTHLPPKDAPRSPSSPLDSQNILNDLSPAVDNVTKRVDDSSRIRPRHLRELRESATEPILESDKLNKSENSSPCSLTQKAVSHWIVTHNEAIDITKAFLVDEVHVDNEFDEVRSRSLNDLENKTARPSSRNSDTAFKHKRTSSSGYSSDRFSSSLRELIKNVDEEVNFIQLSPLLNPIFDINIAENNVSSLISANRRRFLTDALAAYMLAYASNLGFNVIFIDNLQWCDHASLRVIQKYFTLSDKGTFLSTMRSTNSLLHYDSQYSDQICTATAATTKGKDTPDVNHIQQQALLLAILEKSSRMCLTPLKSDEVRSLMRKLIGDTLLLKHPQALSKENIMDITDRSSGLPRHVATLATKMRDDLQAGLFFDIESLCVGTSATIISEFDKLSETDQIVLKNASVVGLQFRENELAFVLTKLQLHSVRNELSRSIRNLIRHHLLIDGVRSYKFADRSIRDGIYYLMLTSQRSQVHGIVAEYLEETNSDLLDFKEVFHDIARHYLLSDNVFKKAQYLERGAKLALDERSYYLAFHQYQHLLSIASHLEFYEFTENIIKAAATKKSSLRTCSSLFMAHRVDNPDMDISTSSQILPASQLATFRHTWLNGSSFTKHSVERLVSVSTSPLISADMIARWIGGIGVCHFKLGNLRESNNTLLLALCAVGVLLSEKSDGRNNGLVKHSDWKERNIIRIDNPNALSDVVTHFEYLFWIRLLHGYPNDSRRILKKLIKIVAGVRSVVFPQLCRILLLSSSSSSYVKKQSSTWDESVFSRIDAKIAVYNLITRPVLKGERLETERTQTQDSTEAPSEDLSICLCRAYLAFGSNWNDAFDKFLVAVDTASLASEVELHKLALLGGAWCSFLTGSCGSARTACATVAEFATSTNNFALHLWALELDIMIRTVEGDVEGTDCAIMTLQTLGNHDLRGHNATTDAVIAFSYSLRLDDILQTKAFALATLACRRLCSRPQGSPIVGVYLFCALTVVLNELERRVENVQYNGSSITTHSQTIVQSGLNCLQEMSTRFPVLTQFYNVLRNHSHLVWLKGSRAGHSSVGMSTLPIQQDYEGLSSTCTFADCFYFMHSLKLTMAKSPDDYIKIKKLQRKVIDSFNIMGFHNYQSFFVEKEIVSLFLTSTASELNEEKTVISDVNVKHDSDNAISPNLVIDNATQPSTEDTNFSDKSLGVLSLIIPSRRGSDESVSSSLQLDTSQTRDSPNLFRYFKDDLNGAL